MSNQAAPAPAMAQLPRELIVEILLWLPVKSILRFRCVSKCLCAVIDSTDFINSHLARSSQNFNLRKMIFTGGKLGQAKVCDVNFDLEEEEEEEEILRLEKPVSCSSKEVYGYCKGLFLVFQRSFYQSEFGLWNPSTRQYKDLPDYLFGVPADLRLSYIIIASGLGYDDATDDYKAFLKVLLPRETEIEVQVWIYGLKSDIWRRAQNFHFDECLIDRKHPGISEIGHFTDNSLHWLYTINSKTEIVGFDMRKETFSLCTQPVCSIASMAGVGVEAELHVLEGCLCISYLFSSTPCTPSQADLYMRKKNGVDEFTWIQLYSVTEPFLLNNFWFYRVKVLGYSKRGHKILLDLGREFMVSYDLKKKNFGKVEIYRDSDCMGSMLSCLCIESLVSVGGDGA